MPGPNPEPPADTISGFLGSHILAYDLPLRAPAPGAAFWKFSIYPAPTPKPDPHTAWIEDVATRLDSALFATAQGWDWTWDQPGVYSRPGADVDDVGIGMDLVMSRVLGVAAPYDLTADIDLSIPYTPTNLGQ